MKELSSMLQPEFMFTRFNCSILATFNFNRRIFSSIY